MRNNIVEILLLLLKGCFDRSFVDPCLSARKFFNRTLTEQGSFLDRLLY